MNGECETGDQRLIVCFMNSDECFFFSLQKSNHMLGFHMMLQQL